MNSTNAKCLKNGGKRRLLFDLRIAITKFLPKQSNVNIFNRQTRKLNG